MIVKRTHVMLGIKARGFDSFLRIHAELDNIKQHLQQALILIVAARRAQDHEWLAIFEHQRRSQGNAWTLARRDVTLRYRQTALGIIWVILQPLLAAGIFSFVFGRRVWR